MMNGRKENEIPTNCWKGKYNVEIMKLRVQATNTANVTAAERNFVSKSSLVINLEGD
jgi:hypothetical protein